MDTSTYYPVGQQNFRELREDGCVYVDKTQYLAKIVDSKIRYWFLARPRRFGKSLFLSTIEYFYKGERDLFKGLFIDSADWKWEAYPVLRLDLNTEKYKERGLLDKVLDNTFRKWEEEYGVEEIAETLSGRFQNIIEAAHENTGRQVVVLVDEYDKPLVSNLNDDDNLEHYRERLASVYSNFKSSAEHIKLVFLTGVSRFSKRASSRTSTTCATSLSRMTSPTSAASRRRSFMNRFTPASGRWRNTTECQMAKCAGCLRIITTATASQGRGARSTIHGRF